jgi:hypothetical protein
VPEMLHTSLDLLICVEQPIEPVGPCRTVFVSLVVGWGVVGGERLGRGCGVAGGCCSARL